jgi:hypothetical protein
MQLSSKYLVSFSTSLSPQLDPHTLRTYKNFWGQISYFLGTQDNAKTINLTRKNLVKNCQVIT